MIVDRTEAGEKQREGDQQIQGEEGPQAAECPREGLALPALKSAGFAIARTQPRFDELPQAHEVEQLFHDMIDSAERTIYIENQFLTALPIAERLAKRLRERPELEVLIVSPPPLCETANTAFAAMFAGGVEQSAMLATLYSDLADELGCGFFDAGSVAGSTPLDGVHLDARNTRAIGKGLEPIVRMMLGI